MLLDFTVKNYKVFQEEMNFSLVPTSKQRGLSYSILKEKVNKKSYRALCSAVVYGPNASGKTNLIGAMDTFRTIILRGSIRNGDDKNSPNAASQELELIPNATIEKPEPVEFSIRFLEKSEENKTILLQYKLSLDLGTFLDDDYPRKVLFESLSVNEKEVFNRRETAIHLDFDTIAKEDEANNLQEEQEFARRIAENNLQREDLFLTNGFKNVVSPKLSHLFTQWIESKFIVVYRADSLISYPGDMSGRSIATSATLNKSAHCLGAISSRLAYVQKSENTPPILCSVVKSGSSEGSGAVIPAELFESYGTVRFSYLFPIILKTLEYGRTLIVDEFDASLHPVVLMDIINIFHNDEINRNHAQLIFNTHNPIFLNANLFRRDEIHFIERDEDSECSDHYTLADFNTDTRKRSDYMQNYFVNRYGAIRDIDLAPVVTDWLNQQEIESI